MKQIVKRPRSHSMKWRFKDDFISLNQGNSAYISPDVTAWFGECDFFAAFLLDSGNLALRPTHNPDDFKLCRTTHGLGGCVSGAIFRNELDLKRSCRLHCELVDGIIVVDTGDIDYGEAGETICPGEA